MSGEPGGDRCVDVVDTGAAIVQRDAKGRQLVYSYPEWDDFLDGVKRGVFDRE